MITKIKNILGLFILLFIFINNSYATHFGGGDLTYKCIGGNTYEITFSFYRTCSGVQAPQNIPITIECSSNSTFNFNTTLNPIPGTGKEITQACINVPTNCTNGTLYGVEEYIYKNTITLVPCNKWTISYRNCCRNNVTTVPNNNNNYWYVRATLDNYNAICNSSPTFTNKPIAIICNNQNFCFNPGANDINGDSLSYSLVSPQTSATANVIYTSPWSFTNFLTTTPLNNITIDPVTGDICFTPNQNLTTIFTIKVTEYRKINGIPTIIGEIYRDVQMKVYTCNNTIPTLSGIDTTLSTTYNLNDTIYRMNVCLSNKPIKFNIIGHDNDTISPGNKFNISWNNGINNATFNTYNNNTDSAYAEFIWQPTSADIGHIKCFTATIRDDACPYNGYQTFSYCILVKGMTVNIGHDTLLCKGETYIINADADSTTINYYWYYDNNKINLPTNQDWFNIYSDTLNIGIHTIKIKTDDGNVTTQCPGIDQIKINIIYQPKINNTINDTSFCDGDSITINAGNGSIFLWTDLLNNPLSMLNKYTIYQSGYYILTVDGGYNTRCIDIDTFEVTNIPIPILNNDTCIWYKDIPLRLSGIQLPYNINYLWQDNSTNQDFYVYKSGIYILNYVNNNILCSDTQIVNVINKDSIITSSKLFDDVEIETYINGNRNICAKQKLKLKAPKDYNSYIWYKNNNIVSTNNFYIFKENNINNFNIKVNVAGCIDSIFILTQNCDIIIPNIITPNNDNLNDNFNILIKETYTPFYFDFPKSKLIIYNRWGKKVYENFNYKNNWNGDKLADGVYYWILELSDDNNTIFYGIVTIIRK